MTTTEKFLAHYGIKGMKWGVRRSRDELARSRGEEYVSEKDKSGKASYRTTGGRTSNYSTDELDALVRRMRLEQQFSQLSAQTKTKTIGRKFVDTFFLTALNTVAVNEARNIGKGQLGPGAKLIKKAYKRMS